MLKPCTRCCTTLRTSPIPRRLAARRPFGTISPSPSPHMPPSLLARAEALATEHATLSKELEREYDVRVAKKVGELVKTAAHVHKLHALQHTLGELNALLTDASTDAELRALAAEDVLHTTAAIASTTQHLTAALVPTHPFAHFPCLLEIRPGAGGGEAALFAGALLRMYQAYCAQHALPFAMLKLERDDGTTEPKGADAPLAEAVMEVRAAGAYGRLRGEAGVHRVQRVPATETRGRTHTSAAAVLVLPSFPESGGGGADDHDDPKSDSYLDPKEIRLELMRARGPGGQHVNKTESAVRLTHLPSGTVVSMQDGRSQQQNKIKAMQLLRARVAQQRREARDEDMVRLRRGVVGVARSGRGDKVRTYNWSQNRVTDHRSGCSVLNLEGVMAGGACLEEVMESVRLWSREREIEQLVAADDDAKM